MTTAQFPILDITDLIPQKWPFVMIDALLAFSDTEITSRFTILETNIFLEDNLFLESGLIENMAQTVALHTGYAYSLKGEAAPMGYIGSIKKVEILQLPTLNETIKTEASILHEFMGITMVEVKAYNDKGVEIASAQMKTVIVN